MKKYVFSTALILGISLASMAQKFDSFGKKINAKDAKPAVTLIGDVKGAESVPAKVEGEVESVCQMSGCWMKVKLADGQTMRVTFKDYGFFVPKDLAGKKVIFEGVAKNKVVSVADQKHYAEDAGASKADIAKITQDKNELTFVADGVLVPKK